MQEIIDAAKAYVASHYLLVLISVITLFIGAIVIKVLTVLLHRFFEKTDFDRTIEQFLERIFKVFLWIILAIVILSNLGVDVTAFVAGLGVIGFIVGFATKDIFSNFAVGLMIMVTHPFKVKDVVNVAGIKGTIKSIFLSRCIIIDEENTYVTIPNVKIWSAPIKNYSKLSKKK